MNYLKEIGAFWRVKPLLEINPQAVAMYLFLLHRFNVKRWPERVSLSDLQLSEAFDIDRRTSSSICKTLSEVGLIQVFRGGKGQRKTEYRILYPSDIEKKMGTSNVPKMGTSNVPYSAKLGTEMGTENVPYSEDTLYKSLNNKHYCTNDLHDAEKKGLRFKNKKEKKPSPSCAPPLPVELQERHKVVFSLFDFPQGVLQIKAEEEQKYLMQFDAYEALVHEGFLSFVMGFDKWALGGWKKKDYTQELNRFRRFNKSKTTIHNGRAKKDYSKTDYSKGWDD